MENGLFPEATIKLSGCGIATPERSYALFLGIADNVTSVAFSPDGKWALSGSNDNTVRLWDCQTGKELRSFLGHSDAVSSVAFSPDGKWALSGSDDKTVRLWDCHTGQELRSFLGHSKDVNSVAFSPDGKWALSGSEDQTIRIWNVNRISNHQTKNTQSFI